MRVREARRTVYRVSRTTDMDPSFAKIVFKVQAVEGEVDLVADCGGRVDMCGCVCAQRQILFDTILLALLALLARLP